MERPSSKMDTDAHPPCSIRKRVEEHELQGRKNGTRSGIRDAGMDEHPRISMYAKQATGPRGGRSLMKNRCSMVVAAVCVGVEQGRGGEIRWVCRSQVLVTADAQQEQRRKDRRPKRHQSAERWMAFSAIKIPRLCKFRSVEIPRKINRAGAVSAAEASPFVSPPFSFVRFRFSVHSLASFCASVTHLQAARVD